MTQLLFTKPGVTIDETCIAPQSNLTGLNQTTAHEVHRRKIAAYANDSSGAMLAGVMGEVTQGSLDIADLWVSKSVRNQGVGSKLLALLEEYARQHQIHHLRLHTTSYRAAEFYKKRGYRLLGHGRTITSNDQLYHLQKRI